MINPIKFVTKFFKSQNQKELDRMSDIVKKINSFEEKVSKMSEQELKDRTEVLKNKVNEGTSLDEILPEAYAMVREASVRINNERHFDVQLIGGIALHENKISEMKTGEGKTLTITLAAYLNALTQKGVHIVTVNDYLAKRDCENMEKFIIFWV